MIYNGSKHSTNNNGENKHDMIWPLIWIFKRCKMQWAVCVIQYFVSVLVCSFKISSMPLKAHCNVTQDSANWVIFNGSKYSTNNNSENKHDMICPLVLIFKKCETQQGVCVIQYFGLFVSWFIQNVIIALKSHWYNITEDSYDWVICNGSKYSTYNNCENIHDVIWHWYR